MDKSFSLKLSEYSKTYNSAYVARVVKIKEVIPIKGSKKLSTTMVCGYPVIVSNNVKPGDIMIFVPAGCAINKDFLSANNLYTFSLYKLNSNHLEVDKYIEKYNIETNVKEKDKNYKIAKELCGFFEKNGKVKALNLLNYPSQGFLIGFKESILSWFPSVNINEKKYVNTVFDIVTVDNEDFVFCEKFVPKHEKIKKENIEKNVKKQIDLTSKLNKKILLFNNMIDGQFSFHTKPAMLNTNIKKLSPESIVQISSKWHGASWIVGKVLCRKNLTITDKIKKFFGLKVNSIVYDSVYASSSSIKKPEINQKTNSFYNKNIWKSVNDIIYPYLDNGMIAYGEVVGYLPKSPKMIQKSYDYGCYMGEFKIIIYRLVKVDEDGNQTEFSSQEIKEWCEEKLKCNFDFSYPMSYVPFTPVYELYYGKLGELYPDLPIDENWHENLLKRMMNDKKFYMEENCHYCFNKVPTEGIVVRVENGNNKIECYKLKCQKFILHEEKLYAKGEIDIETEESLKLNS